MLINAASQSMRRARLFSEAPGPTRIVLYLEGCRTRDCVRLSAVQTFKIRRTLERLPAGEVSEKPVLAPPVPPPPNGTYMPPRTQQP